MTEAPRSIAIIGSGPAGCFLAQALLKADPSLAIDVFDRLPVPYGLVRYGVAADHQGTKAVTRQFDRVFQRQGARFIGNIALGEDVSLAALRSAYDGVVLALGLDRDRRIGVPGDGLAGVHGAGALTRALNGHPDADPLPDLGKHPLILGNGNVALDLLRLLAKSPEELAGSDLGPHETAWLAATGIETLTILGRSPATAARFDPVMVKELAKLGHVRITVEGPLDDTPVCQALAAVQAHGNGPLLITFRFGLTPVAVEGSDGVATGLTVRDGLGQTQTLACTSLLTAIGFQAEDPELWVQRRTPDAPGLYSAGWFARGPRGTIPENRVEAQALAARILADLPALPRPTADRQGLLAGLQHATSFDDWLRIDATEIAAAPEGRCRQKLTARQAMLAIARKTEGIEG